MRNSRQVLVAAALAALGLAGLAAIAAGQAGNLVAARQQYEQQAAKLTDKSTLDEIFALAKWCYQNGLTDEALTHALEAHKKDPNDCRAKYLIYALSGPTDRPTGGEGDEGDEAARKQPTMTKAEFDALVQAEGLKAIRDFRPVQMLLVARCGAFDCHGGGNPRARWALVLRKPVTDEILAENFRAIDPFLNRDKPEESVLLLKPMKGPEGGHPKQEIRSTTDRLYTMAAAWIKTLKTEAQKVLPWGE